MNLLLSSTYVNNNRKIKQVQLRGRGGSPRKPSKHRETKECRGKPKKKNARLRMEKC